MNTDIFEEIKNKIDIADVAEFYGLELDKRNKCVCPFHTEKTASFQVYPKSQSFYCFGCGVGGDVISLTEKLLKLSPIKAAERLNSDFNLGLNMKPHKPTPQERIDKIRLDRKKMLVSSWAEWKDEALNTMIFYEKLYRKIKIYFEPKSIDEEPHPLFVKSCQKSEYLSFLIDEVLTADETERERTWQELYKNNGDEYLHGLCY